MKFYKNKYDALQAAKWLQKNLTVEEDIAAFEENIAAFEDKLNEDLLLNQNKCKGCKIEMQSFSPTAVECPKCGTCGY